MKNENIPADIKSKSLKEARDEIDEILTKLENEDTNLGNSLSDYQRLIHLNKPISSPSSLRKNFSLLFLFATAPTAYKQKLNSLPVFFFCISII